MSSSPRVRTLLVFSFGLVLVACTRPTAPAAPEANTLTVLAPETLVVDDAVLNAFEQSRELSVIFRNVGPVQGLVERIVAGEGIPESYDMVYGIDGLQMASALDANLFQAYASPRLEMVDEALVLDDSKRLLPVAHNYVMINADRGWFERHDLALPTRLEDLRKPEYAALLTLPSPENDQAGRGFLAATALHYGEDSFSDFWQALSEGGAHIARDWTEAYLGSYTIGSSGEGDRPLVLAYASAPAADALYSPSSGGGTPSQALDLPGAGFHQVDMVGIVNDTPMLDEAQALVDFLLGPSFQSSVSDRMFAFPVVNDIEPNESFGRHAQPPLLPVDISPTVLRDRMESWLVSWRVATDR